MNKVMLFKLEVALRGLHLLATHLDNVICGGKLQFATQDSEQPSPAILALYRIGEISTGGYVKNIGLVRADLLLLFELLPLLHGAYYSALWDVITPVHEQVGAVCTRRSAEEILGDRYRGRLDLEVRLGHVHVLLKNGDGFKTYDWLFLGEPGDEMWYTRYEIEALRKFYDEQTVSVI